MIAVQLALAACCLVGISYAQDDIPQTGTTAIPVSDLESQATDALATLNDILRTKKEEQIEKRILWTRDDAASADLQDLEDKLDQVDAAIDVLSKGLEIARESYEKAHGAQ
ncbi:uncharacterized protein LOC131938711 [Physella acuta]|uniref:uncharacterized protein LOC131938711 n=1 Tax=Physella acuta TaxID=109671 RepID=UPI0027DDD0DA|nr:uncharacterized protein LOC131938711 [Physella acuta]